MEETTPPTQQKKDNAVVFYILGGLIVTAIIVAGFLLFPRGSSETTSTGTTPVLGETAQQQQAVTAPNTSPIGSLACTQQWYNTVNGVAQSYYLSTEGEAPTTAGQVTCTFTATVNDQVVATEIVTPQMVAVAARGGATFRCSTQGVALTPGVPTKVTTDLRDAQGLTASCNRSFLLP